MDLRLNNVTYYYTAYLSSKKSGTLRCEGQEKLSITFTINYLKILFNCMVPSMLLLSLISAIRYSFFSNKKYVTKIVTRYKNYKQLHYLFC